MAKKLAEKHIHFVPTMWEQRTDMRKLKPNAVPTIFGYFLKKEPKEIENNVTQVIDASESNELSIMCPVSYRTQCKRKQEKQYKKFNDIIRKQQLNIKALISKKQNVRIWSNETIERALQIKFVSGVNKYMELIRQGQPLPCLRTLQRKHVFRNSPATFHFERARSETLICNTYCDVLTTEVDNKTLQLQALRHGLSKRIYTPKINRAKGAPSVVARFAKSTAIEGKSEILGMSWRKSVKVANVLIINHGASRGAFIRRYDLTTTDYKFLEIGINVDPPSYMEIALGDHREHELPLSKRGRVSTSSDRIFTRCCEIQGQFYKRWTTNRQRLHAE
ncbi:hypothetical protein G5I_04183 [Acromyrmex echinatior]|uniref:Uncharacterized protein n=1 Tax=Acromyrmex echinatior TaxID=103372 RepID=F4WEX9_ACREC|nr:hypothetical protein G5I_04183 [Acromyrmex echinatior]